MSFFKIPIILSTLVATYEALTSPNPPPRPHEVVKYATVSDFSAKFLNMAPMVFKSAYWMAGLGEISLIIASRFPEHPLAQKLLSAIPNPSGASSITVTTPYLIGAACMISAGLLRHWAYRTLGRMFTYHLAIVDEHRLVTEGPYSVTRHPGYGGSVLLLVGTIFTCFAPGGFVGECRILDSLIGRSLVYGGLFLMAAPYNKVFERMNGEDDILRMRFGAEWEEWAGRVPYKLIPWVY